MIEQSIWEGVFDANNPQTKEYFDLCAEQTDSNVFERHHILPRSIFPQYVNEPWNIVNLVYQDHYKAHEYLPQICIHVRDINKMMSAWNKMRGRAEYGFIDIETYTKLKELHNAVCRGENHHWYGKRHSEETKQKMSEAAVGNTNPAGNKHSEETKQKIAGAQVGEKNHMFGKKLSESRKAQISIQMTGENHPLYGKERSDETKQKISASNKGKIVSEEQKIRQSERMTGDKNPNYGKKHSDETRKKMSEAKQRYLERKLAGEKCND